MNTRHYLEQDRHLSRQLRRETPDYLLNTLFGMVAVGLWVAVARVAVWALG